MADDDARARFCAFFVGIARSDGGAMGSHDDVPTAATRTPARMSPSLTARHSCATAASDAIGRPAVSSVHGLKHAGWRGAHVGARTPLARVEEHPEHEPRGEQQSGHGEKPCAVATYAP